MFTFSLQSACTHSYINHHSAQLLVTTSRRSSTGTLLHIFGLIPSLTVYNGTTRGVALFLNRSNDPLIVPLNRLANSLSRYLKNASQVVVLKLHRPTSIRRKTDWSKEGLAR